MKVRDYMATEVFKANLLDGLHQTFQRMNERGVRHMPVVGRREELVGIISDRDLRRPAFVDPNPNVVNYYALDNSIKVERAMTSDPETVCADDPIEKALTLLVENKFGALPVVDEQGGLVGMISAVDMLRAFSDHLAESRA